MSNHPLSQEEFNTIYKKVPRLTVEIIVQGDKGVYLTLRDIEPCKGLWHLPGGTVRFGEPLRDAVARIAKRELGIEVQTSALLGYIEYPSHYLNGLDSPVGIAFSIESYTGEIKTNHESKESGWFNSLPHNMHQEQIDFLKKNILKE
jgi:ADP-ribose pyrophosphatase YjhB (NUDIX family)